MIIQKVIKGIHGLTDTQAEEILKEGIKSNWLRNRTNTNISETDGFWTMDNLLLHINGYDEPIPSRHQLSTPGKTFGEVSPFISTTAGTYETEMDDGRYVFKNPLFTSLSFATNSFIGEGHIFYAYVFVLGRKSISFQQFSEEVREVNIYTDYMEYHDEGEITAKLIIPSVQIEKVEKYNGPQASKDWRNVITPMPLATYHNANYVEPSSISNIREVLG